jgi:hypothetical protein
MVKSGYIKYQNAKIKITYQNSKSRVLVGRDYPTRYCRKQETGDRTIQKSAVPADAKQCVDKHRPILVGTAQPAEGGIFFG